jgi:hypothetical protein
MSTLSLIVSFLTTPPSLPGKGEMLNGRISLCTSDPEPSAHTDLDNEIRKLEEGDLADDPSSSSSPSSRQEPSSYNPPKASSSRLSGDSIGGDIGGSGSVTPKPKMSHGRSDSNVRASEGLGVGSGQVSRPASRSGERTEGKGAKAKD